MKNKPTITIKEVPAGTGTATEVTEVKALPPVTVFDFTEEERAEMEHAFKTNPKLRLYLEIMQKQSFTQAAQVFLEHRYQKFMESGKD